MRDTALAVLHHVKPSAISMYGSANHSQISFLLERFLCPRRTPCSTELSATGRDAQSLGLTYGVYTCCTEYIPYLTIST